nr:MAG TPA: type I neck protein [Caudoviricetes sp.]
MGGQVRFNQGFFDRVLKGAGVRGLVDAAAQRALAAAQASAPVDTGDYQAGLTIENHDTQYRTVARVVGRDPKTMIIESKTGNLARSLRGAKGR